MNFVEFGCDGCSIGMLCFVVLWVIGDGCGLFCWLEVVFGWVNMVIML